MRNNRTVRNNRFEGLVFEGNQYDIRCVNDRATTIHGCYFENSGAAAWTARQVRRCGHVRDGIGSAGCVSRVWRHTLVAGSAAGKGEC